MKLTFVAAVLDGLIGAEDWRAWLVRDLAERGVLLRADGQMRCGERVIGPYRLLDVAQAEAELGGRPWFSLAPLAPGIGKPVGFLTWNQMGEEDLALDQLIPALVRRARGFIARRDDDRVKYPVSRREFSLENVVNRHGFRDGDELLDRSEDALADVAVAAEQALTEAGFSAHVAVFGTHHNPIRVAGDVRHGGVVIEDERAALSPIYFEMWAYDWSILDDDLFWME